MFDEYVDKEYKIKRSNPEESSLRSVTTFVGDPSDLLIFIIGFENIVYLVYSWAVVDPAAIVLDDNGAEAARRGGGGHRRSPCLER